jgi:tRNA (pseudouridine54-N1)-methyltransferase
MYEFILYSRKGQTDGNFKSLIEAGRLDTIYQCILTALFISHGHRKDVLFHAILNGPPVPPLHLEISGDKMYNVRVDERTWEEILRKVLNGGSHSGILANKASFQSLIKLKYDSGLDIYILEEGGKDISDIEFGTSAAFILGDHIGLPKKEETFALRYGKKISLGKQAYLAASCIDIINFTLDSYSLKKDNTVR